MAAPLVCARFLPLCELVTVLAFPSVSVIASSLYVFGTGCIKIRVIVLAV